MNSRDNFSTNSDERQPVDTSYYTGEGEMYLYPSHSVSMATSGSRDHAISVSEFEGYSDSSVVPRTDGREVCSDAFKPDRPASNSAFISSSKPDDPYSGGPEADCVSVVTLQSESCNNLNVICEIGDQCDSVLISGSNEKQTPKIRERKFTCEKCGKTMYKLSDLTKHLRIHTGEKPYCCEHCNKTFSDRSYYLRHKRTKHADFEVEKTHIATVKNLDRTGVEEILKLLPKGGEHYLTQNFVENFNTDFRNGDEQTCHSAQTRQKKPKLFACEVCGQISKKPSDLVRHMRTHTGEKPFSCDQCDTRFTVKSSLLKHQRLHGGVPEGKPEKMYACEECGKPFRKPSDLVKHTRTHTKEKPFSCDQCVACFTEKGSLLRHERMHAGVKPHSCPVCQKSFGTLGNLKLHIRTHTKEKPYGCDICEKCYSDPTDLKRHKFVHSGDLPVACDICGKSFAFTTRLTRHKMCHTSERPFTCLLCSKAFRLKCHLKKHYEVHLAKDVTSIGQDPLTKIVAYMGQDSSTQTVSPMGHESLTQTVPSMGQESLTQTVTFTGQESSTNSVSLVEDSLTKIALIPEEDSLPRNVDMFLDSNGQKNELDIFTEDKFKEKGKHSDQSRFNSEQSLVESAVFQEVSSKYMYMFKLENNGMVNETENSVNPLQNID